MTRSLAAALIGFALLLGTGARASVDACPGVIYVSVHLDGTIAVDGQPAAFDKLAQTLSALKPSAKLVMYQRDNSEYDPNAAQAIVVDGVMQAIIDLNLPIGLSSKPDFSDRTDQNGRTRPITSCPGKS